MDDREGWREKVREIRAAAQHDDDDVRISFFLHYVGFRRCFYLSQSLYGIEYIPCVRSAYIVGAFRGVFEIFRGF